MKAIVVGCGSIGRRHITNLAATSHIDYISVFTSNNDCMQNLPQDKVRRIDSIENEAADIAVIANDTYKHLDTAIILAGRHIHLFIEKPLSHTMDGVDALCEMQRRSGIRIQIGYNMRFLGIMSFIKEQLDKSTIGDIDFVKIEAGQYLPLWRKDRDYRLSYSASASRGGGAALDLSHELDYMRYLFGDPLAWQVMTMKTGRLEMNADDLFEGLYRYNGFICNAHMDCLQKKIRRYIRIEGSRGSLYCDFARHRLTISADAGDTVITDPSLFDMDRTYIDEIDHFINCVKNGHEPDVTLNDGIAALTLTAESTG